MPTCSGARHRASPARSGIISLYAALAIGRMSVVAPITAALSGAGPALFDLATGAQLKPVTLVGLVLALVAVIIVSTTTGTVEEHGMPPLAVGLSVLAGASFACSLVALSLTLSRERVRAAAGSTRRRLCDHGRRAARSTPGDVTRLPARRAWPRPPACSTLRPTSP